MPKIIHVCGTMGSGKTTLRGNDVRARNYEFKMRQAGAVTHRVSRGEALALLRDLTGTSSQPSGMFRDHSCWKCGDGERPCITGNPHQCEYPHARND